MAFLGNPQRFGFPVFVIIDGDGNVLHTQDSALLEQGKGTIKTCNEIFTMHGRLMRYTPAGRALNNNLPKKTIQANPHSWGFLFGG
jgi:hypothetical protein